MKIIFLDIDGVLNGYNFWNQLGWRLVRIINNKKLKQWYREVSEPFGIHTPKFKRLVKIVRKTGAKIVLSSCWRWSLTQTPFEEMDEHELKFYNLCKKYNIGIYDITPRSKRGRRDEEIITWLSRFETERLLSGRYDLECFADKELVQTSSVKKGQMIKGHWQETTGLRNKHVRKAIKILNS